MFTTPSQTHNTAYLYAGTSSGSGNAATTNGGTHLILSDGGTVSSRVNLVGSDVSVTSDANGVVTVDATNKADKQKDIVITVGTGANAGVFNRTTGPTHAEHIDANSNNKLLIKSGYNYTFSPEINSISIDTTAATGDLETNITFEIAQGATGTLVTLPTGAKYVKDEPVWAAEGEYIVSYYKSLFVFGEIGTK